MTRAAFVALLVVPLALAGCGRRGPLEPPPGSTPAPLTRADPTAPAPHARAAGLVRDTSDRPKADIVDQRAGKPKPSSFFLDPLLD
ncbi:MAG: lipoprotein [Hyphomicrobiales bacterium]|nr:lipoprotein [Hyphomicrobiales bacterium]